MLQTNILTPDSQRLSLQGATAYSDHERQCMMGDIYANPDKLLIELIWGMYDGEYDAIVDSDYLVLYEQHKPDGSPKPVGKTGGCENHPYGRRLYSAGVIDFAVENMHLVKTDVRLHGDYGITLYWFAHRSDYVPAL